MVLLFVRHDLREYVRISYIKVLIISHLLTSPFGDLLYGLEPSRRHHNNPVSGLEAGHFASNSTNDTAVV